MAEQELVIEEAQREDAASLARLLETVALESDFLAQDDRSSMLSAEQLATYIESHQHRLNEICLVAKLGHEVIGVCNVTSDQDTKTSHIGDVFIAVSKPYWGNGVGQFLMETMIDWADHTPTIRCLEFKHVMNGRFISIKNLDLTLKALRNVVQELKMENF